VTYTPPPSTYPTVDTYQRVSETLEGRFEAAVAYATWASLLSR
jgi:hypothetical protein